MESESLKQSKIKLFTESFLIYGLGGIISKLIPFIMLPVIAWLIPETSDYGVSDLSNTAMQFGSALAVLGMYDAMYRMFFEKKDEEFQKKVCSTAIVFTCISSVIVSILMVLFKDMIAQLFFKDVKYSYLVYITALTTLVSATNQIVAAPTRMQNKRKVFLVTNTVSPLISYLVSIPLILNGYYIIALPIGALISGISLEITFLILNKKWFVFRKFDFKLLKKLLVIAIPLLPNFLIYWLFNSSDKVMISNLIDTGASGVYSIGSKLGHCSQLIYTAFAGGWQYFAFSTMKESNQVQSNSKVFEYLGLISFIASMYVFSFSELVFKIVFPSDYYSGFIVAPYLFMAPLLQMLFQVAANQFLVIKKTWPNFFILFSGAIINIFLNLILIPKIGIEGAAIASFIGYVFSNIICCIVLIKMKLLIISKRFLISTGIMTIFILLWRFFIMKQFLICIIVSILFSIILLLLYKKEVRFVTGKIKSLFNSKNGKSKA